MSAGHAQRHLRRHPRGTAGAVSLARLPAVAGARRGAGAVGAGQAAADLAADAPAARAAATGRASNPWPASCATATPAAGCSWPQRLADLFDQYQVYRSDWLEAWGQGRDVLTARTGPGRRATARRPALAARAVARTAGAAGRAGTRRHPPAAAPALPRRARRRRRPPRPLARRVVLFGMTHVPLQTLQALAALSRAFARWCWPSPTPAATTGPTSSTAVNCCRLRAAATRCATGATWPPWRCRTCTPTPTRCWPPGAARAATSCASSTPSTTRWRRSSASRCRAWTCSTTARASRLLRTGAGAHPRPRAACTSMRPSRASRRTPADRSIVFHVAHSAQREVEILHDQLLELLAHPPGGRPLQPRDIVVMVPDIDAFAPAIRSVFGQLPARRRALHSATTSPTSRTAATTRCWWRWSGCCACRSSAAG